MKRILIVDDELGIVEALCDVLSEEGYAVTTAHHGGEALALAATDKPDLVITDYMMPLMSGLELAAALRRAGHAALPIILITAIDPEHLPQALDVSAVLRKPFSLEVLLRTVRKLLR